MRDSLKLSVDKLRWVCDEDAFEFEDTQGVPALDDIIGQPRAIQSLEFGLKMESHGYNIYVSGLSGVGRTTLIKKHLEELVKFAPTPDDICYVNNFKDSDCPLTIIIPGGKGVEFRKDIDQLIDSLKDEVPKAFEGKGYEAEVSQIAQESQKQQQGMLSQLEKFATERSFAVEFTKVGITMKPVHEGEPMPPERMNALPPEERKQWETRRLEVQSQVQGFLKASKELNKNTRERIDGIKHRIGHVVVGGMVDICSEKYEEYPDIVSYLESWKAHAVENLRDFGEEEERARAQAQGQGPQMIPMRPEPDLDKWGKYRVNLLVDNSGTEGAPVVNETRANFYNLFGRIERKSYMGAMITNFTMIKSGSILKARGGYLVLNALELLTSPGVWESLKKVIKHEEVRIEDLGEQFSVVPISGMKPDPVPTKLKIIIIGSNQIYHLLQSKDEDFRKIFKVKVDFDSRMPVAKALVDFPGFISTRVREEDLLHFDRGGVASVIEESAREVDDRHRVSTRFTGVADLVREASFWARTGDSKLVRREHVEQAVREKRFRSNLVEDKIRQIFEDGTLVVAVEGERIGQVNGLAVLDLGDIRIGKPNRITVRTWMGRAGVVDIERETKLAGRVYQKGVLILSGFVGAKYAVDRPLALSASIAFEQSYDGVDGDSASSTELYALLSSLSGVPIKQAIAVTGSVNQFGEIQAIGGVNEKIEGYFSICRITGLTGEQGVMIPAANERHLMLNEEVREAVKAGDFHIWSVETIDQGLEILTGVPAGEADADGDYPEGTIHNLVRERLGAYLVGLKSQSEAGQESTTADEDQTA